MSPTWRRSLTGAAVKRSGDMGGDFVWARFSLLHLLLGFKCCWNAMVKETSKEYLVFFKTLNRNVGKCRKM